MMRREGEFDQEIAPGFGVAELDPAGAIEEARDRVAGITRRDLVRGAVGGAAFTALALPREAAAVSKGDVDILNYALVLEYLQASFYTEAERRGALREDARKAARIVGAVERAHVTALKGALGRQAVKRPFFNFRGTTEDPDAFIRTAVAFEDLGTAAYKGQAPKIESPQILAAALSIHSVEARHAAWIRFLAGVQPAVDALDEPKSKGETLRLVRSTRFIVAPPRAEGRSSPRFTG
jgi:Ferritin-like domain